MILEFFTWLTAQATPAARKAGLVAEVAGIAGRHQRHKKAWQPHLNQTSAFIKKHIDKADPKRPIIVLGAGMCLDLPLETLNTHPAGAILVDAVIPFQARFKCWKHKNIQFICHDLTGFLKAFWHSDTKQPISPPKAAPLPKDDYGMVISCNLLSQLPLSFANSPPLNDHETRLTAAMQLGHINALNAITCPILLITDFERHECEQSNTEVIPTVAPQLLPGEPQKEWEWYIAPTGEVRKNLDVKLKVGAWLLSEY